ncbi:uncharacterized protein LOC108664575 [Hyalella azteca]|uniref:Uncharacterized protein LOC108664575 n=1 Tax=Hyalella azteca TaxID=294128 RepID=A0A8B7MZH7_HYAAZ|nr:uncharacterized protein LOC108664575 [Hyalella azteca]
MNHDKNVGSECGSVVEALMSSDAEKSKAVCNTQAVSKAALCLRFLKKELKPKKELIPLKIFAFFFYGGMFTTVPFFTLHMRQVGLNVKEVAVIYSVLPLSAIIGPIISGMIADRTSKFKAVLMVSIAMTTVLTLSLAFIPQVDRTAGTTAFTFNTSGIVVSHLDCREPLQTDEHLTCSSSCLSAGLHEMPHGSYGLICRHLDHTQQIPLASCLVPVDGEMDCGHEIIFSSALGKMSPYRKHKNDDIFIEENCTVHCLASKTGDPFESSEMSNSKTFWWYLALRTSGMLFIKSSFGLMDASIMAVMLRTGGDYGKQRLVAMLSMATFPFIASCIVESLSKGLTETDYTPVFYVMATLLLLSMAIGCFVDLHVEHKAEGNVLLNFRRLLSRAEVLIFLLIIFLLGANWGFIEQYLFVYLKTLGAPTYMLGLTLTFGCLLGIPVLFVSDRIVNKIGRHRVFFMAFVAYSVRMFGYSVISDPWYCFIFEALEVFTYQLMWVAVITFCPILAPKGLLGTMTGIAGAMHFNVGRGGGGFLGGFLIANVGLVWSFRIFGVAAIVCACIYLLLQNTVLHKIFVSDANKDSVSKNNEEKDANATTA